VAAIRLYILDKIMALGASMAVILSDEPDIEVVGAAISVVEARNHLGDCDVLLVSADLPREELLELAQAAQARDPGPQIVLMDWAKSREPSLPFAAAGVAAFALEDESVQSLLERVRLVHRGKRKAKGHAEHSAAPVTGSLVR
jgi:DNA-binding NarL/FixJ family response regulator